MKKFETKGTYTKKGTEYKFKKTITVENEKMVKESLYAMLGGKEKVRRIDIKIEEIKEGK